MAAIERNYSDGARKGSGLAMLYAPIVLILFLGAALSLAAFAFSDAPLSAAEALAAGFGGLAAVIAGLIVAAVGVVVGLFGALVGLIAAGGAIVLTLFIIASPVIALVLIALLLRRPKSACPDPGAH